MRHTVAHRQGLTLVELILALLIIEVALLIMVQTFVQGLYLQQHVAGQSRALLVAQAQMDALLRDAPGHGVSLAETGTFPKEPRPVEAEALGLDEAATEGYRWQFTVEPHEEEPALREITLHLIWTERGRDRQVELVSAGAVPQ
jgi:competence protein ComGC